ncbi:MAG: MFS transporter [Candidatus Bathyarchaeota archaeon]|nr:MAG: MFS transporter [Candidatus Bathyarchaeota archaeon]
MKFEQLLGLGFFGLTVTAYLVLFYLGRKWRQEFEEESVGYWQAPKDERVRELTDEVFRPRLVALFYGLAYFANGYMKITFSMWAPLYLIQVRGVSTFDAALFLGLVYVSWQWKMFIGMLSDGVPVSFRGSTYRRHPWFVAAGVLSIVATAGFVMSDPLSVPVWTGFFPLCLTMTLAGALFDVAADSFAVDVTPPEWHARVLGGVNTFGMSVGGIAASLLSPFMIPMGGYQLVFISGGFVGLLAFPFLILKEPRFERERMFSREAIAFTFTERSVLVASLLMVGSAIGTRRLSNPTGGMFSLVMDEIVGGFTPTTAGYIAVVTLLSGIPASIVGGWAADRWGHRRVYMISGVAMMLSGYLWMTLRAGMTLWFVGLAIVSNFIERINAGGRMALMGDATPLALSATVFQMYMSFSWVGNIPAAIIVGYLLPRNIPLLFAVLSSFTLVPLFLVRYLTPYDAAKATVV